MPEAAPVTEETFQNAPSPFASHPTPMAMPAITVSLDEPTPARPALQGSTPLSFQPTRKTSGSGLSKQHEVHEKETMPSIQLKTEPLSPPPPSAPSGPIRARVLAKSFDHDATECEHDDTLFRKHSRRDQEEDETEQYRTEGQADEFRSL